MAIRATVDFSPLSLEPGDYRELSAINPNYTKLTASAYHTAPAVTDTFANYYSINQLPKETTLVSDTYTLVLHKNIHDILSVHEQLSFANQKPNESIVFDERLQRVISKGLTTTLTALDLVSTHHKGAGETDSAGVTDLVSTRLSKMVYDGINITDAVLLGKMWVEEHDNPVFLNEVVRYALDKSTPDSLTMSEIIVKVLERGLQETTGVSDVVSRNIGKYVADQISALDATTITANSVNISTFNFLESLRRDLHKYRIDPVSFTHTVAKDTTKPLADSAQVQDVTSKHLKRTITEYLFLTDDYSHVHTKGVITPLSEPSFTDTIDKTYSKLISDAAVISDTLLKTTDSGQSLLLQLVEEVNLRLSKSATSTAAISDAITFTQTKAFGNIALVSDQITREFTKHIIDGIRTLDSQDIIDKDISILTLSIVVSEMVSTAISKTQLSSIGLPDEVLVESTKVLGDNITAGLIEYVKRDFVKSLTDVATFTDILTHDFKKVVSTDTAELVSITKREVSKLIEGTDTVGLSDGTVSKAYTPYPKSDTTYVIDDEWIATTLPKSDIAQTSEDLRYLLNKPTVASVANTSDIVVTEAKKPISSTMSFTEQITVEVGSSIFNGSVFNSSTLG